MNKISENRALKDVDGIQQHIAGYAHALRYEDLSAADVHATKVRVIDTLGALIGGFFAEPCQIARNLAAQMPNPGGATVLCTRMKTTVDLAAFVNGTTARYGEMNDAYHRPGVFAGHPSDVIAPVLAAAEHVQATGRDFITSVALAYEAHLRIADVVDMPGFDYTNFVCIGSALGAGKLFGLSRKALAHCLSMAVVPNGALLQSRTGHLSMFKAAASGQAGRAGVFAALLARGGMEGPHMPFEGQAGWCKHVARKPFALEAMGGRGTPFRVQESMIKPRASCGTTQSSILAAEKVASSVAHADVEEVRVEVYREALDRCGTGDHQWNPDSRETADHSIPYVVAAAMIHGTVTPRQFGDASLWNPDLRALMQKVRVVENADFTRAYDRLPVEHRTRVTVLTRGGQQIVGESGGGEDDAGNQGSDAQVVAKFRGLVEDVIGARRVDALLDRLWSLDTMSDVGDVPAALVIA